MTSVHRFAIYHGKDVFTYTSWDVGSGEGRRHDPTAVGHAEKTTWSYQVHTEHH